MIDKMRLKLLVDKSSHRVLFAEAGKEVVDFLFGLLGLPVGTIIKLLTKERMVGSIANIYQSIERLDDTYLQTTQDKTLLLNPMVSLPSHSQPMLFLQPGPSAAKKYYMCPSSYSNYSYHNHVAYVTDVSGTRCPSCNRQMTKEVLYMDSKSDKVEVNSGGGFVKGVVTYTILDDLTVTEMSTISSITLLNKFNIKDLGSLEERIVKLGLEEGLELLKASLQSKTVLTDVFLRKKCRRRM